MSQGGGNTPTQSTSALPAASMPVDLATLMHTVNKLGNAMCIMLHQMTQLMQQVAVSTQTHPRAAKVAVAHPKAWSGKKGSIEARHFLTTFYNYAINEGETLNDWEPVGQTWMSNDKHWISVVLNLMEDEAHTWALPYLELLAKGCMAFTNNYQYFVDAFTKRFAPLDTTEAARDALKALKQGKNSMAEYISKFDQYTSQTGWSSTDHQTWFYDGLNEQLKDTLLI